MDQAGATPLLTSLPPRVSRRGPDGAEIGPAWLARCVASWRAQGFRPFTVNFASEPMHPDAAALGLERLNAPTDNTPRFGRPYVAMDEMVAAAAARFDGPVAIVNADILLDLPEEILRQAHALPRGRCLLRKRLDVAAPDLAGGCVYEPGFDVFVFHPADLGDATLKGFFFGVPWWDHFLPLALLSRGTAPLPGPDEGAYHLLHEERWDPELWKSMGRVFLDAATALNRPDAHPFAQALAEATQRGGRRPVTGLRSLMAALDAGQRRRRLLREVSEVGRAHIERARARGEAFAA